MTLDLSAEDAAVLLEILREELGRLKAEINRTEAHDFKEALKSREASLQRIIAMLEGTATA